MGESCQDCKTMEASFICVCLERHLCDNCLLTHISSSEGNEHRPVSLTHPLLTLLLEASEDADNAEECIIHSHENIKHSKIETQVQKLQKFKERTNSLVDSKIQKLRAELELEPNEEQNSSESSEEIPTLHIPPTKTPVPPIEVKPRPLSSFSSILKEDASRQRFSTRPSSRIHFLSTSPVFDENNTSLQIEELRSTPKSWMKPNESKNDIFKSLEITRKEPSHLHTTKFSMSEKKNLDVQANLFSKSWSSSKSSYKVILIGDRGVGKTTLLSTFMANHGGYTRKPGIGYASRMVNFIENSIEANVWDISTSNNFSAINKSCMYGAYGGLLLFDLTREITFFGIEKRLEEFAKESNPLSVIILVGTRLDVTTHNPRSRFISFERGQEFAKNNGALYDEICCQNPDHVNELLKRLMREIYRRKIYKSN
ncbi:unnamed protein product [Blepharisma stoltei]|uniref:Uncharacterized protein n=1 Tax=Blepharisma stoltei TaxID=1481888 RepID=A0AAU9JXG1_9CILI|nr:unnamed protein product [Blepharisma stoltei]